MPDKRVSGCGEGPREHIPYPQYRLASYCKVVAHIEDENYREEDDASMQRTLPVRQVMSCSQVRYRRSSLESIIPFFLKSRIFICPEQFRSIFLVARPFCRQDLRRKAVKQGEKHGDEHRERAVRPAR